MFEIKLTSVDGNGKKRVYWWAFDRFEKMAIGLQFTDNWMLEKAREHWFWVDSGIKSINWEITKQTS